METADTTRLPKAVLHDHLDGGLRPGTVLELAEDAGYGGLPTTDVAALEDWFHQGGSGSLERYLTAFSHTVAVMQTPAAIERVAYEAVVDLAADHTVYAELRFGPSLHIPAMHREDAIEAAVSGLSRATRDTGCVAGLIVTALRHMDDSEAVARAAVRFAGEGVIGFDLAGPEAGYPPDDHLPACRLVREYGLGLTLHAGEGAGPESVWRAVARCGAHRIGHGARIGDDARVERGELVRLGDLARSVRDLQIPLELCITSNIHTGVAVDAKDHPFGRLFRAGFAVTINTDNRLMSGTSLGAEYQVATQSAGLSQTELGRIVERTVDVGFGDLDERRRILDDIVRPAYGFD